MEVVDQKQVILTATSSSESEEEREMVVDVNEPPKTWNVQKSGNAGADDVGNTKPLLSKQLSMRETWREAKWEQRRRQILMQERVSMMEGDGECCCGGGEEEEQAASPPAGAGGRRQLSGRARSLTDEDLDELRGSIELGFGFREEEGGSDLCDTLPALDLYFAVNRQLSDPKIRATPSIASMPTTATSSSSSLLSTLSPSSPEGSQNSGSSDAWRILSPGDDPQAVKTKLRHWAQAVACSVRQCC